MGIGYQIQYLRQGVSAAILVGIHQVLTSHLNEEDTIEFSIFFQEMLLGMDAEAREAGAQPKTINHLRAFIESKELPETVKTICLTLCTLMEPPERLDL